MSFKSLDIKPSYESGVCDIVLVTSNLQDVNMATAIIAKKTFFISLCFLFLYPLDETNIELVANILLFYK